MKGKKSQSDKIKVKVWRLGWSNMEEQTVLVDKFPTDILKVDDWYYPDIGELCFINNGTMDVVKDIKWGDTHNGLFKSHKMYSFEINKELYSESLVYRIEVIEGKSFEFNGKIYTHQKPKST